MVHYHNEKYHDISLFSVFHYCMIEKCFLVKHNNGSTNELVDRRNSVEGFGVHMVEYENVDIRLHYTFQNYNDVSKVMMNSEYHAYEVSFQKKDYINEHENLKGDVIGSLVRKLKKEVSIYYDMELVKADKETKGGRFFPNSTGLYYKRNNGNELCIIPDTNDGVFQYNWDDNMIYFPYFPERASSSSTSIEFLNQLLVVAAGE
ncbi:unnamed protein product [Adineta steineri]|uniref:Uncharacterized protein n=1 Tax=Adineta steineri TaxID=433720 RepID=A0A818ZJN9_9BILA|nr:unnamed protein product [Adineta steineri]